MSRPPRLLHRLFPSWSLTLTVLAFWLMLADSFTVGQFLFGALLGVIIPLFAARIDREFARIGKLRVIPGLVLIVLWDILLSNLRVAATSKSEAPSGRHPACTARITTTDPSW